MASTSREISAVFHVNPRPSLKSSTIEDRRRLTSVESALFKVRRVVVDVHHVDVHLGDAGIDHDLPLFSFRIEALIAAEESIQ